MEMRTMFWKILLFLCGISAALGGKEANSPDNVMVVVLNMQPCKDSKATIELDINVRDKNDHDKVVDAEFDLDEEFSEINYGNLKVDFWENGAWNESVYVIRHHQACPVVDQYVKTPWKKMRESFSPIMPGNCLIEPGHYKLTDFEVSRDDYHFPVSSLGKYRVTITIYNEFDTEIICQMTEVELVEK